MPIFRVPDESLKLVHLVFPPTLLWLQHLTCRGLFVLLWPNCCWCPNVTSRQWILLIDLLSSTWWMVVHKSKCSLILLWIRYNRLHHNLALALWKLCLLNVHFFSFFNLSCSSSASFFVRSSCLILRICSTACDLISCLESATAARRTYSGCSQYVPFSKMG